MRGGFTGTRNPITEVQSNWLWKELHETDYSEWHHGACVGADEASHHAALSAGIAGEALVVHPPENDRLRMLYDPKALWLPAKPYLVRNRDIVDASDWLIALPDGPERPQSGTWSTVRYAQRVHKPVTICYPDGSLESR